MLTAAALIHASACSLTSLDGYSSGGPPATAPDGGDALVPEGGSADGSVDAGSEGGVDAAVVYRSCADVKVSAPGAPDGKYTIDPDGAGPVAPFEATCDLTSEGGGWMLVTLAMIADRKEVGVTREELADERGGAIVRGYANNNGCAAGVAASSEATLLRDTVPWTQIRARYSYKGAAACWAILGGTTPDFTFDPNVHTFAVGVDSSRDAMRMSGSNGDAYIGETARCDNETFNFWNSANGAAERSVYATLRRKSKEKLAGMGTFASCVETAPGKTSPTVWEYREIYVR